MNNLSIETLKEFRYRDMSPTSGRFSIYMTDAQWQQRFELMRSMILPSIHKKLKRKYMEEPIYNIDEMPITYHGATLNQYYILFINDTLEQLRKGEICECWFVYQIHDLLRFEHDSLRTKYIPESQTVQIWLKK